MARALLVTVSLLMLSCRREAPSAPDAGPSALPARVDWAQVAHAVYLVGEEYQENAEIEGMLSERRPAMERRLDATLAQAGPPEASDADLLAALQALRKRLDGPVDYDFNGASADLAKRIAERARFPMTPSEKPSLDHGAAVYISACAACHGRSRDGQPEVKSKMDPPPSDLRHSEHPWRPYDMFARVTYGGLDTAMPAFGDALRAQDRWDLVFYLFAQRWPPCATEVKPMPASTLALKSDFDLSNLAAYDAIPCLRRNFAGP